MNPELNTPDPIQPPTSSARRNTIFGLVAVVTGLVLTTLLFAPPRKKPVKEPAAGPAQAAAAMPSGCTRNLAAAPSPEPAPQSGCNHCDSPSTSAAAKENCDMHAAPSTPPALDAKAKQSGAPHE